jgi:hypothetical protein
MLGIHNRNRPFSIVHSRIRHPRGPAAQQRVMKHGAIRNLSANIRPATRCCGPGILEPQNVPTCELVNLWSYKNLKFDKPREFLKKRKPNCETSRRRGMLNFSGRQGCLLYSRSPIAQQDPASPFNGRPRRSRQVPYPHREAGWAGEWFSARKCNQSAPFSPFPPVKLQVPESPDSLVIRREKPIIDRSARGFDPLLLRSRFGPRAGSPSRPAVFPERISVFHV